MPTQEEIDYFCSHCDYKDDREFCPREDQEEYVREDECIWSEMDGVNVTLVKKNTLTVGGVEFQREEMGRIKARAREIRKL
tara:strand:- start:156 stop:398 length:243 start_codon:yes stop_codon:yes gene_type:complete